MTTNHHTALAFGGPLTQAAMEAPLSQLDAAIATVIAASSGTSTSLTAQANSGQATLTVASSAGFAPGDPIYIGTGTTFESRIIATVPGGGVTITVTVNLTNTYAIGKPVSKSPAEIVDARKAFQTLGARLDAMEFAVNAKTLGAVGDGVTDDAPEIQAAIAAVSAAGGGTVFLPTGTYLLGSALTIPGDDINIRGAGRRSTILKYLGSGAMILNSNTANIRRRFGLFDLSLKNGAGSASTSGGIKFENFYDGVVDRVFFDAPGATGIGVEFVGTGSTYYNRVVGSWFSLGTSGSTGVKWTSGAGEPNSDRLESCDFSCATGTTGVNVAGGGNALLQACEFEGVGAGSTLLTVAASASHTRMIGCRFEAGVVTIAGPDARMIGCVHAADAHPVITGSRARSIADASLGRVLLTNVVAQSIPNNALTQLTWDTELEDQWGVHVAASADVTIPAGTLHNRMYRIRARVVWATHASVTLRQIHIYKNGASFQQTPGMSWGSTGDRQPQEATWEVALVAGDVISVYVIQASGGALNVEGSTTAIRPTLLIEQIR